MLATSCASAVDMPKDKGGVELWIDLNCPYAVHPKGKQWRFQKSHFHVVYATQRCLLLRCDTGIWAFWLAALHAPHSSASATTRHQWWNNLNDVLSQYLDGAPLFVLIDANGAPWDADGVHVKEKSFATTTNTADFRQMLLQHGLCLPATSEVHQGTNATWTSLDGKTHHCTDHIAIPQGWYDKCTHSQVLSEFDLANLHEDHHAG